ncbi:MAG: hypothetical protein QGI47_08365 [Candidatus Marinimicrobia bacterium]|nr:hypothetical protein [Candidatus Neomarinimicrobiota bacterium]MDP6400120.1 hypothetical protein [Candidatus Neomarinimicrobiota bacterium]MDP6613899.1 hypothetical protein [Candidatus Neomarinimicrobiota bacterium]MDP6821343.1 hypothetical protein [Candidatus Neomarinimicrobiota bacterium]MDP7273629.1 hypothetical protein [Candidatus Neomarinimicrobiota bacterium]
MNREKILVGLMAVVILVYFRGFFLGFIPDFSSKSDPAAGPSAMQTAPETENVGALTYTAPQLLTIADDNWGKDIFYDRSNMYKNRFKLTGITRFEDGYKAIINGDIILEGKKVQGFMVADINEDRVMLKRNKHRVTLKLEK